MSGVVRRMKDNYYYEFGNYKCFQQPIHNKRQDDSCD